LSQTLRDILVWTLLVLAEFGLIAVIVAPRAVARGLKSLLRRLTPRPGQADSRLRRHQGSMDPSRGG
jgi:hypothetical protein